MRLTQFFLPLFFIVNALLSSQSFAESLYNKLVRATVLIRTEEGRGSGVVIQKMGAGNRLLILTNYHVVKSKGEIPFFRRVKVTFPIWESDRTADNGGKWKNDPEDEAYDFNKAANGAVTFVDSSTDLALIEVARDEKIPPYIDALPLARRDPEPNTEVLTVGNAGISRGYWAFTDGNISNIVEERRFRLDDGTLYKAKVIECKSAINPGDSGSALVNPVGEIIGLNMSYTASRIRQIVSEDGKTRSLVLDEARLLSQARHVATIAVFLESAHKAGFVGFDARTRQFSPVPVRQTREGFVALPFTVQQHMTRGRYFQLNARCAEAFGEFDTAAFLIRTGQTTLREPELSTVMTEAITGAGEMKERFSKIRKAKYVEFINDTDKDVTILFSFRKHDPATEKLGDWQPKDSEKYYTMVLDAQSTGSLALKGGDMLMTSQLTFFAITEDKKTTWGKKDVVQTIVPKDGYQSLDTGDYATHKIRLKE